VSRCSKSIFVRRTQSVRGGEFIGNFDANLAIVADRTGVEWQKRILEDILRDRLLSGISRADQTRLIVVNGLDQVVDANCRVVLVE
jgi:hypothetical protein